MMRLMAMIAMLALAGCDRLSITHDRVEDIASDVASDAIEDSDRISALESRIEALEAAAKKR